jgi:hypothetical protein
MKPAIKSAMKRLLRFWSAFSALGTSAAGRFNVWRQIPYAFSTSSEVSNFLVAEGFEPSAALSKFSFLKIETNVRTNVSHGCPNPC